MGMHMPQRKILWSQFFLSVFTGILKIEDRLLSLHNKHFYLPSLAANLQSSYASAEIMSKWPHRVPTHHTSLVHFSLHNDSFSL